jgi:hypothetical protein
LTSRLHFMPRQYDDLNSFGNGTYRVDERAEALLFWDSDTSQPLSVNLGGGYWQERVGGSTVMSRAGVSWRPDDRFSLNFDVEYLDRDGWLLHQADDLFATFQAHQWKPRLSMDYFLGPRQQLRLAFQWVGIKAREDTFLRVPARPGDLFPIDKPTGPGFRPSYDFSVSQYSFQARYRWEIAPLSDIFLVYTRQADLSAALDDDSFSEVFSNAWDQPLQDILVFKIRYRMGS